MHRKYDRALIRRCGVGVRRLALVVLSVLTGCSAFQIGVEPTPAPAGIRYENPAYGFAFRYPDAWELTEDPGGEATPFGPTAPAIELRRADLLLDIQYQRAGEGHFLGTGDVAAGNIVERGPLMFLNQPIRKRVLVLDGQDKATSLRYDGEDLAFFIGLKDDPQAQVDYAAFELSDAVQAELDGILTSFERLPAR